jgi:hypothetical protein
MLVSISRLTAIAFAGCLLSFGEAHAAPQKVGVPECDYYLASYQSCVMTRAPQAARQALTRSMNSIRDKWRQLAQTPAGRRELATDCTKAMEMAKRTMAAYQCSFPSLPQKADRVGVIECDLYLGSFSKCVSTRIPQAARATMLGSLTSVRKAWKQAASTEAGRKALAAACIKANEAAQKAMSAYQCSWPRLTARANAPATASTPKSSTGPKASSSLPRAFSSKKRTDRIAADAVRFIERIGEIASKQQHDCDKMGEQLYALISSNKKLVQAMKTMKGLPKTENKRYKHMYKSRLQAATKNMMAGMLKCATNQRVKEAMRMMR